MRKSSQERIELALLVLILLLVGFFAAYVSFTHVHDWTMRHLPAGSPDFFGWVNAMVSELVPVASLLSVRRRRRRGEPIGFPLFLMILFASLSLAAQLAVATPSVSGWLLSAVPSVAFMFLVKLVLGGTRATTETPASKAPAVVTPVLAPKPAFVPPVRPAAVPAGVSLLPLVPLAPPAQEAKAIVETPARRPDVVPAGVRLLPIAPVARKAPASRRPSSHRPRAARPARSDRRPLAETKKAALALKAVEPGLSQTKLAERLGVSRWTLRDALAVELDAVAV